jgi:hypothetical protein
LVVVELVVVMGLITHLDLDPLEEVDTVHLTKVVEKVEVDNLSMELVGS